MNAADRDALHAAAEIAVTRAFPHPGGGYSLSGAGIEDVVAVAAAPYLDALAAAEARADRAEETISRIEEWVDANNAISWSAENRLAEIDDLVAAYRKAVDQ